jgi:hypothetical protein
MVPYCPRRLVEAHACAGMESCRQASFDKNAEKVRSGRCVGPKIQSL